MTGWISPDCAAGKCRACTGDAWDHDSDDMTGCECSCHCGHDNLTGAEDPVLVMGRYPKLWRCDACGADIKTGDSE